MPRSGQTAGPPSQSATNASAYPQRAVLTFLTACRQRPRYPYHLVRCWSPALRQAELVSTYLHRLPLRSSAT
jgi:hypothetical protein